MKPGMTSGKTLKMAAVGSVLVAAALVSCSSGDKRADGSSSSSGASARDSRSSYQLPAFQEKTLENGLRVLFIPDEKLPYVTLSMVVRVGASQDPADQAGLAAVVAELLDKGTAQRSAVQIANDLGNLGAQFDATASHDFTLVTASALSTQAEPLLNNVLEIVTHPAFSDGEVERMRKQALAQIERRVDNADGFADLAFDSFLFGAHPYGRPTSGTAKSIQAIKKKAIIQQYLRYYRPNNAILAVVGKYTPALAARIESSFATWQKRDVSPSERPTVPAVSGRSFRIVDKDGLVQAQIRMGHVGIKRQEPDFIPIRVASTILGGAFASRLNDRIRKDLGLTYSISSYFDARVDRGPFLIETFTKNESVGKTIQEAIGVLSNYRQNGATQSELDRAKGYLKGVFPTAIETPEKLATQLLLLRLYGVPDTYLTSYLSEVDRLSLSDLNAVIKKHFDDANLKVVVYSSAAQVLEQVKAVAGPNGAVEVKKAAEVF